jgi:glutamyl/glutaminyl-tRNA synthetase
MILGEDGSRLSKRHGATSVAEYRRKGFLSEAMVNFLALLGWSPGENVEIMSRDELVAKFSLERVNKTSAQFNAQKLLWMNGHYIRSTALERLAALTKEYLAGEKVDVAGLDDDWILKLVRLYRERMKTLKDILDDGYHFFTEDIRYEETSVGEHLSGRGPTLLRSALEVIRNLSDFDASTLDRALRDLCAKESVGLARVAQPIRVAVTGRHTSPPIFETLELLGKERTVGRIERTLSMLEKGTLLPKALGTVKGSKG